VLSTRVVSGNRGFSLAEVLLALAVVLIATVPLIHVAAAGQRLAQSQSEATDVNQRIRIAADRLRADLAAAGTGVTHGPIMGSLGMYIAPIVPARLGVRLADPAMTAARDRLTIIYVPDAARPSPLVQPMTSAAAPLSIAPTAPGCPTSGLCGFTPGTRALLFDTSEPGAGHQLFTVTGIDAGLEHDSPNVPFERAYVPGHSYVVPVVQRTYYLDRAGSRVMVYDGYQTDMPLIDNVLELRFSYFADGAAASVMLPSDAATSNCLYDAGSPPIARLEERGRGLVELSEPDLVDGPVCGNGPLAFDGDLLRVRRIRATIRVQAGAAEFRDRSSLFARPGHASNPYALVPDYEVTFDVALRSMMPVTFRR